MRVDLATLEAPAGDTVRWTNSLGHAALTDVAMEIGNNEIDNFNGEYLEMKHEFESDININVDELTLRSESEAQLIDWTNNGNTIDTNGDPCTELYIKLTFWFARARSQALPVIALQYHDIRVKFALRSKADLLVFSNPANTTLDTTGAAAGEIKDGCLMAHFVFLDSMERRLFAGNSHEYLIRNIQVSDFHTKASRGTKVNARVVFNHPVSAVYWFVQKKSHKTNKDYFNYERTDGQGDDTIISATIKFNGSEREKVRGPLYFRVVQPALYFNRTPRKNM